MPGPNVHFMVGALSGSVGCAIVFWGTPMRKHGKQMLFIAPVVTSACGVMALIPDALTYLTPGHDKVFFHKTIFNIFFMHPWLDQVNHSLTVEGKKMFSRLIVSSGFLLYCLYTFLYINLARKR